MLQDFTLIVAGPLLSRIDENSLTEKLDELIKVQKILGFTLIIVTYPGELPSFQVDLPHKIIIIPDPGSDVFRSGPDFMGYPTRNTTRMLTSVVEGLKLSDSTYTIRTRIELLPKLLKINDFEDMCMDAKKHIDQNNFGVAFLGHHYYGLSRQEKGVNTWLPDTFQIMKTDDLRSLWNSALGLWHENQIEWHDSKISFPLANEQVMGLAYFSLLHQCGIKSRITKFHRFKWDKKLIRHNKLAELQNFYALDFYNSGLSESKLDRRFSAGRQVKIELPVVVCHSYLLLFKFRLINLYIYYLNLSRKFFYHYYQRFKRISVAWDKKG